MLNISIHVIIIKDILFILTHIIIYLILKQMLSTILILYNHQDSIISWWVLFFYSYSYPSLFTPKSLISHSKKKYGRIGMRMTFLLLQCSFVSALNKSKIKLKKQDSSISYSVSQQYDNTLRISIKKLLKLDKNQNNMVSHMKLIWFVSIWFFKMVGFGLILPQLCLKVWIGLST